MKNPHEYEVNSAGSLTPFEFYFRQEVVKSKNKINF
jgi:hypothetical protein